MKQDIVLITGGDGYIAKEIVKKYLKNGSKVIAVDVNETTNNADFCKDENYEYYKVDVTKIEELQKLYSKIEEKYGRITHLISAVGRPSGTEIEGIETVTFDDIEMSIKLNLTSHIYVLKIFLNLLEKEDENKTITLISSINAIKAFNLPVYSSAKSGIYGLAKSMTKELGRKGIRINVVSPGTVVTQEELDKQVKSCNPTYKDMLALNEFTKPKDIADAIYALTNETKAITGQNIIVDSGQTS